MRSFRLSGYFSNGRIITIKTIHKIKHEGGRQNPILDFDTRHLRCDVGQSVCERSNFEHSPPLFIFCFRYLSTGKALFENVQCVVAARTVASAHHENDCSYAQGREKRALPTDRTSMGCANNNRSTTTWSPPQIKTPSKPASTTAEAP